MKTYAERVEFVAAQVLAAMVGAAASRIEVLRHGVRIPDTYAELLAPSGAAEAALNFALALVEEIDTQAERADDLARESRERRP